MHIQSVRVAEGNIVAIRLMDYVSPAIRDLFRALLITRHKIVRVVHRLRIRSLRSPVFNSHRFSSRALFPLAERESFAPFHRRE